MTVPDQATANVPVPDYEISAVLSGASAPQPGDTVTFTVYGPGSYPWIPGKVDAAGDDGGGSEQW